MKKLIFVVSLLLIFNCQNDDDGRNDNCNTLPNIAVNRSISLTLPQYSQLEFSTNSVLLPNEGVLGVYVINIGGNFRAFDAADPNVTPVEACSFLAKNGTSVTNSCDNPNTYSLLTGLSEGAQLPCALKEYRVTANGSELTITN
ncbi:MAG: hypothetical protein HRU26_10840 [Psychroserpens sp.]|nr:hypothetical protein [Psychroserpens sp.]